MQTASAQILKVIRDAIPDFAVSLRSRLVDTVATRVVIIFDGMDEMPRTGTTSSDCMRSLRSRPCIGTRSRWFSPAGPAAEPGHQDLVTVLIRAPKNALQVFIDDQLELSGSTYADPGSGEFVLFGESSIYAYGVSEWQFAKHNAYRCSTDAVP